MRVAILAFDGFDELDAFVVLALLNGLNARGWSAEIASPVSRVTSRNGVTVQSPQPLAFANEADAVVFAGGLYTRAIAANSALLDRLQIDPLRQTVGALGSGALLLARLGLLADMPACTDAATRPWLLEAGVRVEDAAFHARGPVATCSGGLASHCLAAWMLARGAGFDAAAQVLTGVAPIGDEQAYVAGVVGIVRPFIAPRAPKQP